MRELHGNGELLEKVEDLRIGQTDQRTAKLKKRAVQKTDCNKQTVRLFQKQLAKLIYPGAGNAQTAPGPNF